MQWAVWGLLGAVILAIVAAFSWTKLREEPLPDYGSVSDFSLTNQFGKTVSLSDLKGTVWLADIIFTRCPGPCLRMTKQMREIQRDLPVNLPIRFVSFTADPEYDTPEVLNQYARRFDANSANWWFLTGPKKDIYDLSINSLKLAVAENTEENVSLEDMFIHSTRFALVDRHGRVRAFFDGEDAQTPQKAAETVQKLLKEK